jgi:predicted nicotinamide N-methyase
MKPPYCLAVSSILNLPTTSNFLATQVWPSARVAAKALEEYTESIVPDKNKRTTICELGCGPGLPSLTAAAAFKTRKHPCQVIATDIDDLALDLVSSAAKEQGLESMVSTRIYDLIAADWDGSEWMEDVDLFVMSDVFETKAIAKGAAKLTHHVLDNTNNAKMWVFAQSDRAQREVYWQELQRLCPNYASISRGWVAFERYDPNSRLCLCDLDETKVSYG